MNATRIAACALILSLLPLVAVAERPGGGGFSRPSGGGFSRPSGGGYSRPSGGFDMHNDAPWSGSHSSTGPAGTTRHTSYSNTGSGYNRSTTSQNGNASRTSTGSASNGTYNHSSTGSTPYGSHASSSSASTNGNYSHTGSGSNAYGSYNTAGGGNVQNGTNYHTTNASNVYGQTYHGSTYASNGYVYHGAVVTNPVYGGYNVWGWNSGVAWYPVPIYWGGGFWGPYAVGAASAAVYGSYVNAANQSEYSYQVQPDSPGAKLLASYNLTQTPCGPPNLVVIYGPNGSAICAQPNNLVSAGNYSVDSTKLTIVSEKGS